MPWYEGDADLGSCLAYCFAPCSLKQGRRQEFSFLDRDDFLPRLPSLPPSSVAQVPGARAESNPSKHRSFNARLGRCDCLAKDADSY